MPAEEAANDRTAKRNCKRTTDCQVWDEIQAILSSQLIATSRHFIQFIDMDSGALLESFFQRYLTKDLGLVIQTKLSPNETVLQ
jgi:vacuolar-type H+-ATPase subunit C/Vma6